MCGSGSEERVGEVWAPQRANRAEAERLFMEAQKVHILCSDIKDHADRLACRDSIFFRELQRQQMRGLSSLRIE